MDGTDYFYETLGDIYDDKSVIEFLKDFHSTREHSFFIGLPEEELTEEELDKPNTYKEYIMIEDFRREQSGSDYYKVEKKRLTEYITLRDILLYLRKNKDIRDLSIETGLNTLILIMKKSEIHYTLFFSKLKE